MQRVLVGRTVRGEAVFEEYYLTNNKLSSFAWSSGPATAVAFSVVNADVDVSGLRMRRLTLQEGSGETSRMHDVQTSEEEAR